MKRKILITMMVLFSIPVICLAEGTPATSTPVTPTFRPVPEHEIWIAFLPVIFFSIIFLGTIVKLALEKVKLAGLLVEKNPSDSDSNASSAISPAVVHQAATSVAAATAAVPGTTAANVVAAVAANPPSPNLTPANPLADSTPAITNQQSTSRLIALLSGLTTLAIGACLSTFYLYECFSNQGSVVDLSKLSTVLISLGIGMLPYGFNQASAAVKK